MKKNTRNRFFLIFVVLLIAGYFLYPTVKWSMMSDTEKEQLKLENQKAYYALKSKTINLGLDLQGGMHVILEVDVKELLQRLATNKDETFFRLWTRLKKRWNVTTKIFSPLLSRCWKRRVRILPVIITELTGARKTRC